MFLPRYLIGLRSAQLCTEVIIKGTLYSKGCVLPLEVGLANKVTSFGKIHILAVNTCVTAVVTVHIGKPIIKPTKELDSHQKEFGLPFLCSSNARHVVEAVKDTAELDR